jgi:hypothetical protein
MANCLTCEKWQAFYTLEDGEYRLSALGRCKNERKKHYTNRVLNCYSTNACRKCSYYVGKGGKVEGQLGLDEVIHENS